MRLVFAGTPDVALPSLDALIASAHDVVAVVTRPDAPAGRGRRLVPSPVAERASQAGIPVLTPTRPSDPDFLAALADLAPECCPVVAYGALVPRAALDIPAHGWVNLHFSLLPAWRGAAPVQHAVLHGDAVTGATTFGLEEGLDTGPVYAARPLPIGPTTTSAQLHERLAALAAEMIPGVVQSIAAGMLAAVPQPEVGVTYASKLARDEGRLSFTESAELVERRLRALNPAPGCWCEARGERLSLLAGRVVAASGAPGTVIDLPLTIACGNEAVAITQVQRAGRRPMPADELQRGFALPLGTVLG